jgi:lipopolysaccharide biosynthesis regulator YciM
MKISLFKEKLSAKDVYIRGLNQLLEGKKDEALECFIESAKADSENVEAYYHAGNVFRDLGNAVRAVKVHSELLQRPHLSAEFEKKIKLALVRDYIALKDHKKAEALILDTVKGDKSLWLKEELLKIFEATHNWEKAVALQIDIHKKKKAPEPDRLALYYIESACAVMNKNGREARIRFKEAIKLNPLLPWPYVLIADTYFKEDRVSDALEFWSKLFDTVPARAYIIFDKIEKYYFEAGEYGEVGRIYQGLLEREPDNIDALLALSRYLFKKGDKTEAFSLCKKVLSIQPLPRHAYAEVLRQVLGNVDNLDQIKAFLADMTDLYPEKKRYVCRACQTRAAEALWRCSACGEWLPYKI